MQCGERRHLHHGRLAVRLQYFEESRKLLDPDRAKDAAEAAPSVTTPQQAAPASAVVT